MTGALLTADQAKAAIVMFESRHFDTAQIAELLGVAEASVARTLAAARDIVIAMHREGLTPANDRLVPS